MFKFIYEEIICGFNWGVLFANFLFYVVPPFAFAYVFYLWLICAI